MSDEWANPQAQAQAEAQARAKMREMLLKGEAVKVSSKGIIPADAPNSQNAITIPEGILKR
jgi:hypothetical protein